MPEDGRALKTPPAATSESWDMRLGVSTLWVLEWRVSYAPCANCRSSNNGRLKYFYLAAFDGQSKLNYRLRLCQVCVGGFIDDLVAIADRQDPEGIWRPAEWWA